MCASILARTLVDSHNAFPHQNHEVKGVFETCRVFLKAKYLFERLQRYSRSTATGRLVSGVTSLNRHLVLFWFPAPSCCVSLCSSGFSQLILFMLLRSGATKDTVFERRKGGEGLGSSLSFPSNPHHPHLPLSGKFNRLTLRI